MKIANFGALIAWQWSLYGRAHQDRRNLLIHVVAVPLFVAGALALPLGLFALAWQVGLLGVLGMAVGFGLQGLGHRFEPHAPPPFANRTEFVIRIFAEQLVVFPRFVLSGEWLRGLRNAKQFDAE